MPKMLVYFIECEPGKRFQQIIWQLAVELQYFSVLKVLVSLSSVSRDLKFQKCKPAVLHNS
jgi:hypothetical protein